MIVRTHKIKFLELSAANSVESRSFYSNLKHQFDFCLCNDPDYVFTQGVYPRSAVILRF